MPLMLPSLDRPFRLTAEPALTREEFWRFSADSPDLRMERQANGDVTIMSPTTTRTGERNFYINGEFSKWVEADGRGAGFDSSTGFNLPDGSTLSPDASWVLRKRLEDASQGGEEPELCPDFVIELRSKSDRLAPAREKMQLWMANGCQLAWLIDPARNAVEVYRPGREPEVLEQPTSVSGEGPVSGFVLNLTKIWS